MLNYDPNTGLFRYKSNNHTAGMISDAGYTVIRYGRYFIPAHSLACIAIHGQVSEVVDHGNRFKLDNRSMNIIESDPAQNSKNKSKAKNNKSGHTGVSKAGSKFKAYIGHESKCISLGTYSTMQEAIDVREAAEVKYGYSADHGADPIDNPEAEGVTYIDDIEAYAVVVEFHYRSIKKKRRTKIIKFLKFNGIYTNEHRAKEAFDQALRDRNVKLGSRRIEK